MKKSWFWLFFVFLPCAVRAAQISTATGQSITFDSQTNTALIKGDARVDTSTAIFKADQILMNNSTKEGHAVGNVVIEQTSGTITGSEARYNWETSTGTVTDVSGHNDPYYFSAKKMDQKGPQLFHMRSATFTTCDADPPHYHLRSSRATMIPKKRIKMTHTRLTFGDLPSFYMPFYTKSLEPKRYTLRIEPGQSGRDGLITRSWLGYPFTPNTYTKFKWNWYQFTGYDVGIEHDYNNPKIKGHLDYLYRRDFNSDPQPERSDIDARWNHWQRLWENKKRSHHLSLRASTVFLSRQTLRNDFSGLITESRVENKERGLTSEGEVAYQHSKYTLTSFFRRNDKFDSDVSSRSFISQVTLPRLTLQTNGLVYRKVKMFLTANWENETNDRLDPNVSLRYRRSALTSINMLREFLVSKKLTLTPNIGYEQRWRDRRASTDTVKNDIFTGLYRGGVSASHRTYRFLTSRLNYNYVARLKDNRSNLDSSANDRGIVTNKIGSSINMDVGRQSRIILSSGYNLKQADRSTPDQFRHKSARFDAPTLDFNWEVRRNVSLQFRETYALFDASQNTSVRRPLNTSGGFSIGNASSLSYFEHLFSYTRTQPGQDAQVIFSDKLRFFLTPKWYLDFFVSYRAQGPQSFDYRKVFPIQRSVSVVRDLHCWYLRMDFLSAPDRQEVSFHIDLKTSVTPQENVFTQIKADQYFPYK